MLSAQGLAKSYGGRRVFGGVGVDVAKGDKLVVVGVNGAGKSTLLRIIAGRDAPDSGELQLGHRGGSRLLLAGERGCLASERQVIEELEAAAPTSLIPEVRTLLGAFLFRGDDVFKSVSVLSGGRRAGWPC